MKKVLLLFVLGCLTFSLGAQSTSTQGKDFWLSFMHNGYYDRTDKHGVTLQVIISAKRSCTGTISNPFANWSQDFSVGAYGVTTLNVMEGLSYHDGNNYGTVSDKGIHIIASDTISVYCVNIADYSFDASFVLPTNGLGDEYIIQCCDQSHLNTTGLNDYKVQNQTSSFLIVATEDNTVVNITLTATTLDGRPAGVTYSVTLAHAGQTYHVRSLREGNERDLSGSRVVANDCKKIAVFNGNTLTRVPIDMSGTSGFDHVFEQAMPVRSWGKEFIVTSSMSRNRDFIKITSNSPDNEIYINNSHITTLNANQSYWYSISNTQQAYYIKTSKTAAIYLYNTSAGDDNHDGDPSMVWIAPIEQRVDEVTFSTFSGNTSLTEISNHYVNIVVNTDYVNQVYLDGHNIQASEFSVVPSKPEYSYTRKNIPHGSHHLACPDGFNAHVYGFGDARGYAYLVGSKAIDLSTNMTLNDIEIQYGDLFQDCVEDPIVFSAEVNYQDYELFWDFGDGETSSNNPVTHIYHDRLLYQASLIVITDESGCVASANDTTLFYIDLTQHYITQNDETCSGDLYSGYGFSNVLITNDTILSRTQANPVNPNCNDSVLVYITAWPDYHNDIADSRCWTNEPDIYNDHGFHFEYDHPDTYHRELQLETVHGCDSIITLTLVVGEYQLPNPPIDLIRECYRADESPYFLWDKNNRVYQTDTIDEIILPDPDGGCDFKYTLDLRFHQDFFLEENTELVCDQYTWWVTGETITEEGEHTLYKNFKGGGGQFFDCDSIYTKTVVISGQELLDDTIFTAQCDSISFLWFGQSFTYYSDTVCTLKGKTEDSCYREQTVIIEGTKYTPAPEIHCTNQGLDPHWVITASEFNINRYNFIASDPKTENTWNDESHWAISKESWQIVESDDHHSCLLYPMDWVEDTVWLSFTARNSCAPEGITQRFYLIPSYYSVNEPELAQPIFSVVPNPNNGEMEFHFDQMTGKIDIKVYDMRGILIDQFETFNNLRTNTLPYQFKHTSSGIYFFVATAREGSVAQKVVIK